MNFITSLIFQESWRDIEIGKRNKFSYEDTMTGVNELIHTVMDDDKSMKSVLTTID